MTLKNNFSPLGKVIKPHGLRGDLIIFLDRSWFAGLLSQYNNVMIDDHSLSLLSVRRQARFYIARFQEIKTVVAAEELRGHTLCGAVSHLKDYAVHNHIYLSNLWIGFSAEDETGRPCGTVESVIPTGSNDVLVLKLDHQELLLPVTPEYVLSIDEENKHLLIKYPEMA